MYVYLKYVVIVFAFIAGFIALRTGNLAAGITAAGAFIAFALIEIQDLKTANEEDTIN